MNKYSLVLFLCFVVDVFGYKLRDAPILKIKPHWLKVCRRNDPQINKCLTDLFYEMFPHLAIGIPEMKVDPFEPLTLDKVSISKGSGAITLAGSLYNLNISGPSNATPTDTEMSFPAKQWNFDLELPLLNIKSTYNLKGHILVLPLVGHGACELRLHNVKTKVLMNFTVPLVDGREVIRIDSMKVKFTVGKMRVKLHNLFNGNKLLGQTVNTFINNNAIEIINELEDSIGESLASIFTDLMNNIYTKIPLDLWYLTDEQYDKYLKEEKDKQENANKNEPMVVTS